MMKLDERKEAVLEALVRAFIESAEPVSSAWIASHSTAHCSPATVRNEMGELEAHGLIEQPHTSAGRVPTDFGYRYFVDYLMPRLALSQAVEAEIERVFHKETKNLDELLHTVARLLSTLTDQAGIVFVPALGQFRFRQVNLVGLDAGRVLVIWVSTAGFVKDCVLDVPFPLAPADLVAAANFLNREFSGVAFHELQARVVSTLETEAHRLRAYRRIAQQVVRDGLEVLRPYRVALEGASAVLEQPEFADARKSRHLVRVLEQNEALVPLLAARGRGVTVQIGSENEASEMQDCSLVSADYTVGEDTFGRVGILGPRRMRYAFMVALVGYVSKRLAKLFAQG